jgi:hypothetical protein
MMKGEDLTMTHCKHFCKCTSVSQYYDNKEVWNCAHRKVNRHNDKELSPESLAFRGQDDDEWVSSSVRCFC